MTQQHAMSITRPTDAPFISAGTCTCGWTGKSHDLSNMDGIDQLKADMQAHIDATGHNVPPYIPPRDELKEKITAQLAELNVPCTILIHPSKLLMAQQITEGTHHTVKPNGYAHTTDSYLITPTYTP